MLIVHSSRFFVFWNITRQHPCIINSAIFPNESTLHLEEKDENDCFLGTWDEYYGFWLDPSRTLIQTIRHFDVSCRKRSSRTQLRQNFFSNRVVNLWNNLPEEVVMAQTVNCFKGRLDKYNADKRFSMERWYKTDTSCSKRLPCHADVYSMRQHMKIGQQASCLMYRMMMMMMIYVKPLWSQFYSVHIRSLLQQNFKKLFE